jgi:hypothetical protein
VTTVAGVSADVTTVAGIAADVTAVAAIDSDVTTVAADGVDIGVVAGISASVSSVAGISANVTTVAGISANVTTVAGISSDVTTVATNVADITNFSDVYIGPSATDPTLRNDGSALQAGDLYFNTATDEFKVYTGAAWQATALTPGDFLQVSNNLSDVANAATARTNLGLAIGTDVQAYDADTAKLDVAQSFTAAQRGSTDTDTSNTGSVTLDFAANQNFVLTLTGNVTLANPTTEQVGQSGFIVFIQDATGSRTVSLGTDYETAGGAGLTLSSAASATDVVPYIVAASGRILLGTPQLAFS